MAEERSIPKQSASSLEYQYIFKSIDENNDGKFDHWIRESFTGNILWESFDYNKDGKVDKVIENIDIKNATKVTQDTNFDDQNDVLIFIFKKREYKFIDSDHNGFFDELDITCKVNHRTWIEKKISEYKISASIIYFFPFKFLIDQLSNNDAFQEDLTYVLQQTSEKYEILQTLLKEKKWDLLFKKTREYLNLPSNKILPIELQLQKAPLENTFAQALAPNIIQFYPDEITDLETWLISIDHECLHIIQRWRPYFELSRKKPFSFGWGDLVTFYRSLPNEFNPEEVMQSINSKGIEFTNLSKIMMYMDSSVSVPFVEFEAYMNGYHRFEYYLYPQVDKDNAMFLFENNLIGGAVNSLMITEMSVADIENIYGYLNLSGQADYSSFMGNAKKIFIDDPDNLIEFEKTVQNHLKAKSKH